MRENRLAVASLPLLRPSSSITSICLRNGITQFSCCWYWLPRHCCFPDRRAGSCDINKSAQETKKQFGYHDPKSSFFFSPYMVKSTHGVPGSTQCTVDAPTYTLLGLVFHQKHCYQFKSSTCAIDLRLTMTASGIMKTILSYHHLIFGHECWCYLASAPRSRKDGAALWDPTVQYFKLPTAKDSKSVGINKNRSIWYHRPAVHYDWLRV